MDLKRISINLIYGTAAVWSVVAMIYGAKEIYTHIVDEPSKTALYLFLFTALNAGLICIGGLVYNLVKMIEET